jgi:hypothetical protein
VQREVGTPLFSSSYESAKKIAGTVPAASGTALWERYPTRDFFSQARKEGSNIARYCRPDAESGQVFRSTFLACEKVRPYFAERPSGRLTNLAALSDFINSSGRAQRFRAAIKMPLTPGL